MWCIKDEKINELVEQKSRFIAILKRVDDKNEVFPYLKQLQARYPKATHYCYAYKIEQEKRFQDDGEPSKTAGLPILNVLETNQLDHILCVVIRYFGGIKLGTGGLVRTYTKAVTEALKSADLIKLVPGQRWRLQFSYENQAQIDYLLSGFSIHQKEYDIQIYYEVDLPISNSLFQNENLNRLLISKQLINSILIEQKR